MPRIKRLIRKRYTQGTEVLCSEIEETLVFGSGVLGVAIELRTLEDWKRYWADWRATIMPKALEALPGRRPFAMYVCGEIPPRPVAVDPPLVNGFFKIYVPSENGTGRWHYQYPEPYQQAEHAYLFRLGVIAREELNRYRTSVRTGQCARAKANRYAIGNYICEMGLHE